MSLKRKLVAGCVLAVLIAGAATGAGLAASGHGGSVPPAPRQLHLADTTEAGFLRAAAQYLGTDVATLRHEAKTGHTVAQIANETPGRSAKQLAALLIAAGSKKLQLVADRALSKTQQQALRKMLHPRITGFLNDTCPLRLAQLGKHLGGCGGMGA